MRWIWIGGVGLALAVVIGWLFVPRPTPVDLAVVASGPIAESVADQGSARIREAYVVAAPVGGRLHRIDLDVGDRVTAGRTAIARIDPAAADLLDARSRTQAEAGVAAAAATVRASAAEQDRAAAEAQRSEANLTRVRSLAERGVMARQALEDAEAAARTGRAAVRAAAAGLAASRADLVRARAALSNPEANGGRPVLVTAPVTGYVTRVFQESARTVMVGAPLVEVGDSHGLEAAIEFLSQDAVRIREGMTAEVYDWGGPGVLAARVRRVEPQGFTKISALGVEEQRVLVFLQFTDPPADRATLGPGYRVWGRVFLRRAAAVKKAPLGALVRAAGGWAAFKVVGGKARLTLIKVGALTDQEAEVTAGLSAGDQVIVFPSDSVRDGVRVRARRRQD